MHFSPGRNEILQPRLIGSASLRGSGTTGPASQAIPKAGVGVLKTVFIDKTIPKEALEQ